MTYGCCCDLCGRTYETEIWQKPFWCWKCIGFQLRYLNDMWEAA